MKVGMHFTFVYSGDFSFLLFLFQVVYMVEKSISPL